MNILQGSFLSTSPTTKQFKFDTDGSYIFSPETFMFSRIDYTTSAHMKTNFLCI